MSLLVDPDYLLQSLRLDYLTRVPDPFGASTLTFSPASTSTYVALAGLDDLDVWPELRDVRSPEPVRIDVPPPRRRAENGLKYSETIGGSGAAAGMRVTGKRTSRRRSSAAADDERESDVETKRVKRRTKRQSGNWVRASDIMGDDEDDDSSASEGKGKGRAIDLDDLDEHATPVHPARQRDDQGSDEADEEERSFIAPSSLRKRGSLARKRLTSIVGSLTSIRNPPVVTVQSPVSSPAPSPHARIESEDHSPASSTADADSDLPSESEAQEKRRLRTATITHSSSFSHDQELSDALRWDEGADSRDPAAASLTTTSDEGPLQAAEKAALSDDESRTADTWNELGPGSRAQASSADDEFSFIGKGLHPSASQQSLQKVNADEGAIEAKKDEPAQDSLAVLQQRRRERRRVNISLRVPLQVAPPIKSIVEEDENGSRATSPVKPSTSANRNRARTNSYERQGQQSLKRKASAPSSLSTQPEGIKSPHIDSGSHRGKSRNNTLYTFPIHKTSIVPRSQASALTALLAASSAPQSHNPYTPLYGALASRTGDALRLSLFFPHSREPRKQLVVSVRRDVSVEEVIGFGLWSYWEQKREPRLGKEDAEELKGRLDPAAWNLMMAEDDGEVDDDFPALDRLQPISKVGTNEFGIVEASASQAAENRAVLDVIQRRPSRVVQVQPRARPAASVRAGSASTSTIHPSESTLTLSAYNGDLAGSTIESTPLARTANALVEPDILLRIRIPVAAAGGETVISAVKVPSNMYLQDVLELVCRKRREYLRDHRDYVLLLADKDIVVPLDRTVESLAGNHSLRLVRRSTVPSLLAMAPRTGNLQNTNPSGAPLHSVFLWPPLQGMRTASIFKRLSEPVQPRYVTESDIAATFKEWVVYRKHAMSLGRHERILTVDGDYVTIKSAESGRTASYHVSSIVECKQSRRMANSFKLTVYMDNREMKRFDFEAKSVKQATEIIASVKGLLTAFKSAREAKR